MEIHPLNQSEVRRPHQRVVEYRTMNVRRWDRIVEAWAAGDGQGLDAAWVDQIVDLGNQWGQYEYAANVDFVTWNPFSSWQFDATTSFSTRPPQLLSNPVRGIEHSHHRAVRLTGHGCGPHLSWQAPGSETCLATGSTPAVGYSYRGVARAGCSVMRCSFGSGVVVRNCACFSGR